jgi:hypothetical protein
MGNPLEIYNFQDQVFGVRITKNEFEKYEVMDWINPAETDLIIGKFIILFSRLVRFETCARII